ncbi:hypothetical protein RKD42_001501 [Streptomyces ambofaciens]
MAALGVSEVAEDATALLEALRRLTAPGRDRRRRIAAGRALFTEHADALTLVTDAADAARAGARR